MTGIALGVSSLTRGLHTGIAPDDSTEALHVGITLDDAIETGAKHTGNALDNTVLTGPMGITLDNAVFAYFFFSYQEWDILTSTKITSSSTSIGISVTLGGLVVAVTTVTPSSILGIG